MYDLSRLVHLNSYKGIVDKSQYERLMRHYADTPTFKQAYLDKRLMQLDDPSWTLRVAELNGQVAGFKLSEKLPDSSHGAGLYVAVDLQGQGIGRLLMQDWIDNASSDILKLEVLEKNTAAKRLYEKLGFVVDGVAKRTFFGEKMLTMSRVAIDLYTKK